MWRKQYLSEIEDFWNSLIQKGMQPEVYQCAFRDDG